MNNDVIVSCEYLNVVIVTKYGRNVISGEVKLNRQLHQLLNLEDNRKKLSTV